MDNKKPKLRFRGFTDDWKQRMVGELVKNHNAGIYISKEKYGEGINVIGVGNIYDNDIFDGEIYRLGPVNDDKFLLDEGDLIYGESSLVLEGIARTVCVGKNGVGSAFAWHTRRVKLDNNIVDSHFATLELNYNPVVRKYLMSVATQTAITGMTTDGYFSAPLFLPSLFEQNKISAVFKHLDKLITLHQSKYEQLLKYKNAMIDNMFPKDGEKVPKIRFKGFTSDWEHCKVAELFKITRGYVLPATETESSWSKEKPYPVYSSQTKDNGLMGYHSEYLYENAITWTTDGANAGTVNYRAGKFYCTNVCGVLLSDRVKANKMISEAINKVAKGYVSYVGNPKLMNNVMADIDIYISKEEKERENISEMLEKFDNLIALHQRNLESLKNIKKSLLEKMFI